jgi:fructose-1-phosphate kinase PfkB-like protein
MAGLKAKPYLIKPNARETEEALGIRVRSLPQVKKALQAFRKMGIAMALISLGERGAGGIFKEEVWHCGVPKVTIKNNVGCGDAFLGAFLGAAGEKNTFPQALAWATAAGTVSCQSDIPGNVQRARIEAFVKRVRLKRL